MSRQQRSFRELLCEHSPIRAALSLLTQIPGRDQNIASRGQAADLIGNDRLFGNGCLGQLSGKNI
jgi:hypothetical protein